MEKDKIDDIKLHFKKKSGKYYIPKDLNNKAFVKIDNFWWELDISTPLKKATVYNMGSGRMTEIDVSGDEICEAKDWQYLNWEGTEILSNKYETGWLDRDGKFYGCDYRCHSMQAELIHNADERSLELAGYIKITNIYFHGMQLEALLVHDRNHNLIKPTQAQLQYLNQSNIKNLDSVNFLARRANGEVEEIKQNESEFEDEM